MTCFSCDPDHDDGRYDREKCLDGYVYGECGDENCYGVCENHGYCTCPCHGIPEGSGPLTHAQLETYWEKAK